MAFLAAFSLTELAGSTCHANQQPKPSELYERGAEAYREARYEDALKLLAQAHEAEPHPELAYDLGRTYEALGDLEHAIRSYREYLDRKPDAPDAAVVLRRIENLQRRADARRPRVVVTSSPTGALVRVGARTLGKTPFSGRLDAGTFAVTVEQTGFKPERSRLTLHDGEETRLHLQLEKVVSPVPPSPVSDSERGTRWSAVEVPTWVSFGVAAAGFGTALGFELARRQAEEDARQASTQLEHAADYAQAERNQKLARGFLAVGGAATVVGGTLLFLDLRGSF